MEPTRTGKTPQKFDSVVRTFTASAIAIALVASVIYLAVAGDTGIRLTPLQAVLIGWAGIVVGFYFGGHTAQNTQALEEDRLRAAMLTAEASALRSEAASEPGRRDTRE